MPRGLGGARPLEQELGHLRDHVEVLRVSCIVCGVPCMCIRHTGTPASRTTSAISGSWRSADTSFTKLAPASIARRATSAFIVSIETGTLVRAHQPLDHRDDARQLPLHRHRLGARPRRLAADVDQVGAGIGQEQAMRDRGLRVR